MHWDASIDIVAAHLEPGADGPGDAVERVRAAVQSLPCAGWVSVAWCGRAPAVRWVRVYPPGRNVEPDGPEWDAIRRTVGRTVTAALA